MRRPMPRWRTIVALAILGSLAGTLPGCGSKQEKVVPVGGAVSVNGKPLASGVIMFNPDRSKGNMSQAAPIGKIEDGNYELTTGDRDGAPLGWYLVTISAGMPKPSEMKPGMAPVLNVATFHTKYTNAGTTDLSVEVVESPAPGTYDLKLAAP